MPISMTHSIEWKRMGALLIFRKTKYENQNERSKDDSDFDHPTNHSSIDLHQLLVLRMPSEEWNSARLVMCKRKLLVYPNMMV